MRSFKVAVVGAGYVGLVTGACLAHMGHKVTCVDRDAERVKGLKEGRIPIYEPYLEDLIAENSDQISFSTSLDGVVEQCDILFIAVDTPQGEDGAADLSSVAAVVQGVGRILGESEQGSRHPLVVVNKSTVPVGSGEYVSMLIEEEMSEAGVDNAVQVVSNPEFLREGSAVLDTLLPDRIVLGSSSSEALETMHELYRPILERRLAPLPCYPNPKKIGGGESEVPFVSTDVASAEMIKYAANAFLATKISFINEVSNICELVGADVENVARGIGLDERIGSRFLHAGIGWGGSCFPKDLSALRSTAREYGYETKILDATMSVNQIQRRQVIVKLQQELQTLKGKRVALLGLSYKPRTDDLRDAPSLYIARELHALGARVVGYDPVSSDRAREELARSGVKLKVAKTPREALDGAHAAALVTEWEEVRDFDYAMAAREMAPPRVLVDGRNALEPSKAYLHGLRYRGFGRD